MKSWEKVDLLLLFDLSECAAFVCRVRLMDKLYQVDSIIIKLLYSYCDSSLISKTGDWHNSKGILPSHSKVRLFGLRDYCCFCFLIWFLPVA